MGQSLGRGQQVSTGCIFHWGRNVVHHRAAVGWRVGCGYWMDWAGSLKLKIRVSNVEAENAKTDDLPAMTAHKTK